MALTRQDGPKTRRWRSRAFVQPLLITTVGVVVSVALYNVARGPTGCPSEVNADTCGYYFMGGMGAAMLTLPVTLVGLLITAFVVGASSDNFGLAFRGVLVGVLVASLVAGAAIALGSGPADGVFSALAYAAFIGLVVLIPVAFGFGVGRAVRPGSRDRPSATGPG